MPDENALLLTRQQYLSYSATACWPTDYVSETARDGLSLIINMLGASGRRWLGVAVLANGMTITCARRLDPALV